MEAHLVGEGLEAGAELADLGSKSGEGVGLAGAGPVFLDDGAKLRPPVQGRPAETGTPGDPGEGDGLAGSSEFGAGGFDTRDIVTGHDA